MSVHDRWGPGARSGPGKRWEVRYRESGRQAKKRFDVKAAAERFQAKMKTDPEVRRAAEGRSLTIDKMIDTWLATKAGKARKTIAAANFDAKEVRTQFGSRLATSLRTSEIRTWAGRDRGNSVRRRSLAALRQAYKLAIEDELVDKDPTARIPLPKLEETSRDALTWDQLEQLAEAAGDYGPMIWLLGTCGLRIGEACALNVADVGKTRLRVRKSKTGKARDVPILPFVRAMLDLTRPGPLFRSPSGGRVDAHNWRVRVFDAACDKAGFGKLTIVRAEPHRGHQGRILSCRYEGISPHELRHTAASLAIASGATVDVVARMLGHSPEVCLRIYNHLFDSSLDSVVERMETAHAGGATVIPIRRAVNGAP